MKNFKFIYLLPILMLAVACSKEPEACFTYSESGLTVDFDGGCSLEATSYDWDFGDGSTSIAEQPSHTYSSGGTYDVTLRVSSKKGKTSTITQTVSAQCPVGYSGANCATTANSKMLGYYSITESCNPSGPAGPYGINITASTPPYRVMIQGLWETGTATVAGMVSADGTTFSIDRQNLSFGFEVDCNNGTINGDGSTLTMTYNIYTNSGSTAGDICNATLTR